MHSTGLFITQKFNYSLDKHSKNFNYQESDIMLDEKLEELHLMHFKPTGSLINEQTDFELEKSKTRIRFDEIKSF